MKIGTCKDTCAPGIQFYKEGREYLVDETDPFIKRHFTFPKEEVAEDAEKIVEDREVEEPPKRGRKKQ